MVDLTMDLEGQDLMEVSIKDSMEFLTKVSTAASIKDSMVDLILVWTKDLMEALMVDKTRDSTADSILA